MKLHLKKCRERHTIGACGKREVATTDLYLVVTCVACKRTKLFEQKASPSVGKEQK